ncbi:MAG: hypothetical protein M1830_000594 [Pleopsidium flavum]|nr:MAG: hypothetical protein M1830_000594 [Pleopsidium flavum]
MYPPSTPTKSHDNLNSIVRSLSAKWSLRLPIRETPWSPSRIENPHNPKEKVLTRLRYLYFQNPKALNGVIAGFEEWARPVISDWKWKPRQEHGTIPTSAAGAKGLPGNSFLKSAEIPESAVNDLLTYLLELLDDEIYLMKASIEANLPLFSDKVDRSDDHHETDLPRKTPRARDNTEVPVEQPRRQIALDFGKAVPQHQSDSALNGDYSLSLHKHKLAAQRPSRYHWPSAVSEHPSSDEFLPSQGWLGHAEDLSRSEITTAEVDPKAGVDNPKDDVEVFTALPAPSSPPPPVVRDDCVLSSTSTSDNNDEATNNCFIKMFDAVHITHPISTKKRSSDTTEDLSPRKVPCNFISHPPLQALKVSTYVPASQTLRRALKDAVSLTTTNKTLKESFDSEISFVESNASQFSLGSQLTQLTEPDDAPQLVGPTSPSASGALPVPDRNLQYFNKILNEDTDGKRQQSEVDRTNTVTINLINETGLGELPRHLLNSSIRVRYEISRFAARCNIPFEDITLPRELGDYDELWRCLVQLARAREKSPPERSDPKAWLQAGRNFENVTLTGDLQFCTNSEGPVFQLQLKPMKMEMSCRLFRRFGNDRFLVIGLPGLEEKNLPKHLHKDWELTRQKVIAWLAQEEHSYLGRIWKAFYVKAKSERKRKVVDSQYGEIRHLVYFFATDGCDFESSNQRSARRDEAINTHAPMDISELWDWFCPREQNKKQTYCKMFSRMALGLSKTHPTVVFRPSEIRRIPDTLADLMTTERGGQKQNRMVMNDGCARISRAAAWAIAEILGIDAHVPSAFQGRIGGAKGLWMIDIEEEHFLQKESGDRDFWIEVTDSQLKFEPHSIDLTSPDPDRVTFEVHSWSKPLAPASLNFQLLPILEDRGVPRSILAKLLQEDLTFQITQQKASMDQPVTFRKWNHDTNTTTDERVKTEGVKTLGSLPETSTEQINWFLDSGFHPKTCSYLKELAWDATFRNCERLEKKLSISVGQSAYAYITCDPLKVLNDGEIHLGFSKTFSDPLSRFQDTMLHGIDVLVARLPALLPSDVQRVKAVFKPELRGLKDIAVFSAKGPSPLAGLLSGGDYDGDRVWICWDPSIVDTFQNAAFPSNPPCLAELGITRDTTTVADLASSSDPMAEFLQKSFEFYLEPNLLGICTSFHERMCYARKSINTRSAVIVATLLGHLVDRGKQGLRFTEEDWQILRRSDDEIYPKFPPPPAYKEGSTTLPTSHIIDYLVFQVAKGIRQETLADFAQEFKDVPSYDPHLASLYKREQDDSTHDPEIRRVLHQLNMDIAATNKRWLENASASEEERAKEGRFSACVEETHSRFVRIMPADSTHPLVSRWRRDAERNHVSHWSLLRASAAFIKYHRGTGKFLWYVAGRELGIMKAAQTGRWRAVVEPVYAALKPDAGYVKKIGSKRLWDEGFGGTVEGEEEELRVDV